MDGFTPMGIWAVPLDSKGYYNKKNMNLKGRQGRRHWGVRWREVVIFRYD